jgi:hypothetical protein
MIIILSAIIPILLHHCCPLSVSDVDPEPDLVVYGRWGPGPVPDPNPRLLKLTFYTPFCAEKFNEYLKIRTCLLTFLS